MNRTVKTVILTSVMIALVAAVYVWIISARSMVHWKTYGTYYSQLADGFVAGHTYLPVVPDPQLLALPDPYDPATNSRVRLHDAALYDGRYYLYWGPVPAFLLAMLKLTFRSGANIAVGDQYLTFAFAVGTVTVSALLLLRIRERFFSDLSPWTIPAGIAIVGLAGPIPFTLSRASVYEASILGGQCFLLSGLFAAICGLFPSRFASTHPMRQNLCLLAASICWSAAVGCRISLTPAVAALGVMTLWRVVRGPDGKRRWLTIVAFALPASAAAFAMASYNHSRFGSWTETGWRYQLASFHVSRLAAAGGLMAPKFIFPNAMLYFFEWPRWTDRFPYVQAANTGSILRLLGIRLPPSYVADANVGLIAIAPILCLALSALSPTRWRQAIATRFSDPNVPEQARWIVTSLLLAGTLGFLPALSLGGSTLRYAIDLSPTLAILATIGLWLGGPEGVGRYRQRLLVSGLLLLGVYSVVVSVLISQGMR